MFNLNLYEEGVEVGIRTWSTFTSNSIIEKKN